MTGWCGCRGAVRDSSSGWTSPRSRPRTRRPSAASSAGTASPPGARPASRPKPTPWRSSGTAEQFLADNGSAEPFGPVLAGYEALPEAERRAKAAALAPTIRGNRLRRPAAGRALHRRRSGAGVPLPGEARPAGRARHLLPGSLPANQGQTTRRRPAGVRVGGRDQGPAGRTARGLPRRLPGLLRPQRAPASPAIRGADPAIVLVPGVGMFSFGKDKQTARVAGEFYVNAINVMRGAESVSTYHPI